MKQKLSKVRNFVVTKQNRGLVYFYPEDTKLLKVSLTELIKLVDELILEGLVLIKRIVFAPSEPQPTFPMHASFISEPTHVYNIKVLELEIDPMYFTAVFDKKKSCIKVGKKIIPIEFDSKQYYFCTGAFEFDVGIPISWDEVCEKMDFNIFNEADNISKAKKDFDHISRKINNKLKREKCKRLFKFKSKMLTRLY